MTEKQRRCFSFSTYLTPAPGTDLSEKRSAVRGVQGDGVRLLEGTGRWSGRLEGGKMVLLFLFEISRFHREKPATNVKEITKI